MGMKRILTDSQSTQLGLKATGRGTMQITGLPSEQRNLGGQWAELCKEFDAAQAAVNAALAPVNAAFRSAAEGTRNRRNPTEAELDALESARAWEDAVRKKMDAFIARNT